MVFDPTEWNGEVEDLVAVLGRKPPSKLEEVFIIDRDRRVIQLVRGEDDQAASYGHSIDLRSALSTGEIRGLLEARRPEPAAGRPGLVDLRIHVEDDPAELESIREWLGFEPTARIALHIDTRAMTEAIDPEGAQLDAAMALVARTRSAGGSCRATPKAAGTGSAASMAGCSSTAGSGRGSGSAWTPRRARRSPRGCRCPTSGATSRPSPC